MSAVEPTAPATAGAQRSRTADPAWRGTAVAGVALLGGLSLALAAPSHALPAVAVSLLGVAAGVVVLGRRAAIAVFRHPVLVAVAAIALLVVLRVVGLDSGVVSSVPGLAAVSSLWSGGGGAVWTLTLMALAATGGLVLIADALRVRLGLARARPAPWQQLTDAPASGPGIPWRAVAGVALIGWVAFLGVGLAGPYVGGNGVLQVRRHAARRRRRRGRDRDADPDRVADADRSRPIRAGARGRAAAIRGAPARLGAADTRARAAPSRRSRRRGPASRDARSTPCGPGWPARPS